MRDPLLPHLPHQPALATNFHFPQLLVLVSMLQPMEKLLLLRVRGDGALWPPQALLMTCLNEMQPTLLAHCRPAPSRIPMAQALRPHALSTAKRVIPPIPMEHHILRTHIQLLYLRPTSSALDPKNSAVEMAKRPMMMMVDSL